MTIEDIIETLAKTDTPDGRINAFITCAFHLTTLRPAEPADFDGAYNYIPSNIKTEHGFLMATPYTSSVGSAFDLCNKLVPDGFWFLSRYPPLPKNGPPFLASISDGNLKPLAVAESRHPALALTLAALRAYVKLKEPAA